MGDSYRAQGKLAMAEEAWLRGLELERKAFGESHPQVAFIMGYLSGVYSVRKQFDLAREYDPAVHVMKITRGENSLAVAAAPTNAAPVEQRASALQTAADTYNKATHCAHASGKLNPGAPHRASLHNCPESDTPGPRCKGIGTEDEVLSTAVNS
jgi:hypothetical protein